MKKAFPYSFNITMDIGAKVWFDDDNRKIRKATLFARACEYDYAEIESYKVEIETNRRKEVKNGLSWLLGYIGFGFWGGIAGALIRSEEVHECYSKMDVVISFKNGRKEVIKFYTTFSKVIDEKVVVSSWKGERLLNHIKQLSERLDGIISKKNIANIPIHRIGTIAAKPWARQWKRSYQ
jgi:hypothetical protein